MRHGRIGYWLALTSNPRARAASTEDSGPKLVGDEFLTNWATQPVSELFDWIRQAMPPDAAGTLSKEDAAAVVAYILKQNKMPAGKQALPSESEELRGIAMTATKP